MSSSTEVQSTQVWHLKAENPRSQMEEKHTFKDENKMNIMWEKIRQNVYIIKSEGETTKPMMVFSVIGDSGSFVPTPWPANVFQTALIEAAKSGGETWILYRGREEGVSKVVEEAYRHYENIEFWMKPAEINDQKRHIKLIDISGEKIDKSSKGKDIETIYKTEEGENNNLEMEFERFVSEQEVFLFSTHINFKIPVPVAIIVCEGDLKTIAKIANALQKNLPVIIMKGSGKAADLTLDCLENPEELWKIASILFGIALDGTKYSEIENYLKEIEKHKELVSVFDLHRDDPLMFSNIVGDAIIKCMSMKKTFEKSKNEANNENVKMTEKIPESNALNLSIRNSALVIDGLQTDIIIPESFLEGLQLVPRTYVLRTEYCTATSLPLHFYFGYQILQVKKLVKKIGHVLLFEALKANRCDYVKVLLDRGVIFDIDYLDDLYIQTVLCTDCGVKPTSCLHIKWDLKKIPQAKMLYTKLRKIVEDRTHQGTNNDAIKRKPHDKPVYMKNATKHMCLEILRYDEHMTETSAEDDSIANVLLWAIFVNRKDVAEICWLRGKDHLLTGLICSAILEALSKNANDVKEHVISKDLQDHSKLFEQRCIRLMDRMYEENEELAIDLMHTEANIWGIRSSPLTFAYENYMYDITAHTCSQKYMNNHWWNNLEPDMKSFLKSAFDNSKNFGTFIQAPRTKYVINYIIFLSVLIAYSIFVLTSVGIKYHTSTAKALEIYVYIWSGGDGLEEIFACFGCEKKKWGSHRGITTRIGRHLYDFWNVVDLLSYFLTIAALFMRHFYKDDSLIIARNLFALSLLVMYLRFLEVFLIHKIMGPTLMMIKEMLKDLLIFLLIAVFLILGVGIYYHANLWPDHRSMWNGGFANWSIWKIIYYPYWQLYGEFNLDFLHGSDHSDCNVTKVWESDMSMSRCPHADWTVPFIAAIFVLFSNLLLVNLVIAMFSYTFERVKNVSEKLWYFQRYTVITDYSHRIPSPFNLIFRPIIWICSSKEYCSCKVNSLKDTEGERRKKDALQSFQKIVALRYCNQK